MRRINRGTFGREGVGGRGAMGRPERSAAQSEPKTIGSPMAHAGQPNHNRGEA